MTDASTEPSMELKISKAIENDEVKESLRLIEDLKFFLATAPANWQENQVIRRYYLNRDEGFVSCIFWNNLYYITGTDIVRCIVYKFQQFGRKIIDRKKFEEGIFSDLRNLKCGTDAILESPKSPFLDFLFKNNCLRTQKKQKVFFWFNVPHDKLMADALERDLRKEKNGQTPTTIADREPALSFQYQDEKLLYNQLVDYNLKNKKEGDVSTDENSNDTTMSSNQTDYTEEKGKEKAEKVRKEQFEELPPNSAVPVEDQDDDDDDDFPLDYFQESNDYIIVDQSSNYVNYPAYVDTHPDLVQPFFPQPVSNQVVLNDEYLIEQTLPVKTPLSVPRSAKPEDYHQFPPLSAKFQQSFGPPSGDQPHFIPHSFYQQDPYVVHDPEYWHGHDNPYSSSPGIMIVPEGQDPILSHPQGHSVMVPYGPHPGLIGQPSAQSPLIASPAFGHFPQHPYPPQHAYPPQHSPYAIHFPTPSARQQSISASMMKKKHQMAKKNLMPGNKIAKPFHQVTFSKPPKKSLGEKAKRNVNFQDSEDQKSL